MERDYGFNLFPALFHYRRMPGYRFDPPGGWDGESWWERAGGEKVEIPVQIGEVVLTVRKLGVLESVEGK